MKKRFGILSGIIVVTLIIIACSMLIPGLNVPIGESGGSARPSVAKKGELAPEINLKAMTGEQVVLSKLEGNPVIVNFWATWCGPCREEFPAFVRAVKKYKDQGLVIIGVNYQDENSDEGVLTFMRNTLVNFPIVRDRGERYGRAYGVRGLPTTFFIDRKGVIRDIVVGGPVTDQFIDKSWTLIN